MCLCNIPNSRLPLNNFQTNSYSDLNVLNDLGHLEGEGGLANTKGVSSSSRGDRKNNIQQICITKVILFCIELRVFIAPGLSRQIFWF